MLVMCEKWVGNGWDWHILSSSSSDYSSTSSSFCWAAQPAFWGPKSSDWSWLSLRHLIPNRNFNSNSNSNCNWNWTQPAPNSNSPKPSVAPSYIIVWHSPTSSGRPHLHWIQPRPRVKVIFWYLRPDAPVSSLTTRSWVNMLQSDPCCIVWRRQQVV